MAYLVVADRRIVEPALNLMRWFQRPHIDVPYYVPPGNFDYLKVARL